MTIVKHSALRAEVSKREVFWLPVFLIFQHSQLFSTLFFTVFQYFSLLNSKRAQSENFIKKLLCSSTEYNQSGRIRLNLHIHFYCIPAWCVRIKTLYSSIACVHFYEILHPWKTYAGTVFQHFSQTILHFESLPAFCFACISTVFQHWLRAFPLLREAFWIVLDCLWAAQRSGKLSGLLD